MKKHGLTALITCLIVACVTANADMDREWNAVGDDGNDGLATGYVMAVSQDSVLIAEQSVAGGSWNPAPGLIILGPDVLPTPSAPGTLEAFSLDGVALGMATGTWFASVKAFDELPNYSPLGNIFRFEYEDQVAPAAIFTLQ